MKFRIKLISVYFLAFTVAGKVSIAASTGVNNTENTWENWAKNHLSQSSLPVVQNRQISKLERFQLMGSFLGSADRGDLYNNYTISSSVRYHFTESHAWELFRVYFGFPTPSSLNNEVIAKANYKPDVQLSRLQFVSSYVFSPIYGKYAWNENHTVYFDLFGTAGAGLRVANDLQPIAEFGLGMNHYLFSRKLSIVPEYRMRMYSEQRTQSTWVLENLVQLGIAWLL